MSMTEQFNVQPAPQRKVLGIEFGSTRIKAVLTDGYGAVLATGSHTWENQLVNGIWTYPLEQVWNGLQACYRDMADPVPDAVRQFDHRSGCNRLQRHDARLSGI